MNISERKHLTAKFLRNFSDILVEGIKGLSLADTEIRMRYRFTNPEVMNRLYDQGHDVVCVGAHYANWEWGMMAAPLQLKHRLFAFYTPVTNQYIDVYLKRKRERSGTTMVSTRDVRKTFNSEKSGPVAYFFGADQSPSNVKGSHWMTFLEQDTACMKGPEFFARRYGMPVVYFDVQRIGRGEYTVALSVIENDAKNTSSGQITENYMHTLERIIRKKPEDYLWSHRRWKHSRKTN